MLLLATRLRTGYANMAFYADPHGHQGSLMAAAGIVRQALKQPGNGLHQAVRPSAADCIYLLFFDGCSRGDPGPGGSGVVVVRLTANGGPYQAIWACSMSYAARTTANNVAKNMGPPVVLSACCHYGYSPAHGIGDSAMIIRQQRTRQAPKAKHLKPLY